MPSAKVQKKSTKKAPWKPGCRELSRDPALRTIIRRVGPCLLAKRRDYFIVLCKSIFAQQISTRIANIMFKRFRGLFPRGKPTPQAVLRVLRHDAAAKTAGLSRQKRAYILDLARHFAGGEIPTRKLARMNDEEVIECLTRIKGIGRWTAEMFLIFVLNRPDVWPVDDLGVAKGPRIAFKLAQPPAPKNCENSANASARTARCWRGTCGRAWR